MCILMQPAISFTHSFPASVFFPLQESISVGMCVQINLCQQTDNVKQETTKVNHDNSLCTPLVSKVFKSVSLSAVTGQVEGKGLITSTVDPKGQWAHKGSRWDMYSCCQWLFWSQIIHRVSAQHITRIQREKLQCLLLHLKTRAN